ncbi:MAG: hypothetical protein JO069_19465 [Verrucomicrobia bacterium]|nr:hypothetical protein [Verrucomicrobiota bacterium]
MAMNEGVLSLAGRLETLGHEQVKDRAWNYLTLGYGRGDRWWRAFCYRLRRNDYDGWRSIQHEDIVLSRLEGAYWGATEQKSHLRVQAIFSQTSDGLRKGRDSLPC